MEQPSFTVQHDTKETVTEIPVTQASSWDDLFLICRQQNELIRDLRNTVANLSESVAYLTRKLYGSSREKLPISGQLDLFGNMADADGTTPESSTPVPEEILPLEENSGKKGGKGRSKRKDLFSDVETEKEVIPLPEEQKVCEYCGAQMEFLGEEFVREEFQIKPMEIKRIQYYSETWVCSRCQEEDDVFSCVKSEAPRPLISHSMASPSAVAYVIYQRFLNSMPFYRIEQDFRRISAPIGRETLASWVITCALTFLEPLFCLLFLEQKQREILHGDETPCQVLHEKDREATAKSYIWLIVTGDDGLAPVITYHYSPSRGHEVPEGLLGDFKGYFHTDKYDGYNCLEDHVIRCLCWAHGRRKWYDAIPASLKPRGRSKVKDLNDLTVAEIGFLYCDKLFEEERKLKECAPEEKKEKRLQQEKPLLDSFFRWLSGLHPLKGSKLEKAVNYFADAREGFENYLKDGRCSISNNAAENAARPYVVGRKNFLFHNSVDGARASAIVYSLALTAKANKLDVLKYFEVLLQRMPDYQNEPEGIRTLLPWSPEMQSECHKPECGDICADQ